MLRGRLTARSASSRGGPTENRARATRRNGNAAIQIASETDLQRYENATNDRRGTGGPKQNLLSLKLYNSRYREHSRATQCLFPAKNNALIEQK